MKKIFYTLLFSLLMINTWALTIDGVTYYVVRSGEEVEIAGCNSSLTNVVIPSNVTYNEKTYSVTSIGDGAFSGCKFVSLELPNSVTNIGNNAFSGCDRLMSLELPNSVTNIGEYAFSRCNSLMSLELPNSVISIGDAAFSDCSSLQFNEFDNAYYLGNSENPYVVLVDAKSTDISSCEINSNCKCIYNSAFYDCSNLTSLVIPNSVTNIGEYAFSDCSNLTSLVIPNSVTNIGEYAFSDCSSLQFNEFDNAYYLGNSENPYVVLVDAKSTDISSCEINSNCKCIYNSAFYDCSNLISVVIPNSVTNIGEYAFSDCSSLTSLVIPNSVTNIGDWAFYKCSSLMSLELPNSVISIGEYAFYKCSSLTSVVIPNSVISMDNAFNYCERLISVVIPNSVISIGDEAFKGCYSLSEITCYATLPPKGSLWEIDHTFTAYVPCGSFKIYNDPNHTWVSNRNPLYDEHSFYASDMTLKCIATEETVLSLDKMVVVPEKNEALFKMPINASADSYTLTIQNNGVTFCTLTFNAQGQLFNIDFSTTKSYELKSDVAGFQFTVTGLSTASEYGYSFKVWDKAKGVLKEYAGSFTTKNEDGTGGSCQGGDEVEGSGQGSSTAVSEVSNTTAVTVVNGQILVNGEAPAFVVTVAGQKIANANLKSGVYFVVVDGNCVSVVVR